MRLIDADRLMEHLGFYNTEQEREENVGQIITLEDFDRMPTAYDVDKVVEQLQKISDEAEDEISVCEKEDCLYFDGFSDGVDKAIEIVKGGGVDE